MNSQSNTTANPRSMEEFEQDQDPTHRRIFGYGSSIKRTVLSDNLDHRARFREAQIVPTTALFGHRSAAMLLRLYTAIHTAAMLQHRRQGGLITALLHK
jgi:hypothetical protein